MSGMSSIPSGKPRSFSIERVELLMIILFEVEIFKGYIHGSTSAPITIIWHILNCSISNPHLTFLISKLL